MIHEIIEFEKNLDPVLAALVVLVAIFSGIAGWAVCQLSHRQRGLEVDRIGPSDFLPMPPAPVIVPDHVPQEWEEEKV